MSPNLMQQYKVCGEGDQNGVFISRCTEAFNELGYKIGPWSFIIMEVPWGVWVEREE